MAQLNAGARGGAWAKEDDEDLVELTNRLLLEEQEAIKTDSE